FAAMVTCLDDNVGRIVEALKDRGMLETTLIAFSSDNGGPTTLGPANGPPRRAKGGLDEGGVRVPALAAWAGHLQPGTVVPGPARVAELLARLSAYAKEAVPRKVSGAQPADFKAPKIWGEKDN